MTGTPSFPTTLMAALRAGDINQCAQILIDSQTTVDEDVWTADERNNLRWALVAHRDKGNANEALAALRSANLLWPNDAGFVIERLVLLEPRSTENDLDATHLKSRLAPVVAKHPVVQLFLALRAAQDGALTTVAAFDALSSPENLAALDPFAGQMAQLGEFALLGPGRTDALDLTPPMSERFNTMLAWRFLALDRAGDLNDQIRQIAFENTLAVSHPASRVLESLKQVYSRLSVEGRASALNFMTAIGAFEQAKPRILAGLEAGHHRQSLYFAKAASIYAMRTYDAALERRILTSAVPSTEAAYDDLGKARHLEMMSRRNTILADRPLRVFIGFFGQFRAPDSVLLDTILRLQTDFTNAVEGPFELHFGLSTWAKSGARALAPSHPSEFFREILPQPLQPILSPRLGRLGHDLEQQLPNTVAACQTFTQELASRPITADTLAKIVPNISAIIDHESDTEQDLYRATEFPSEIALPHINQFKMWSRIARLKLSAEQTQSATGQPMDAFIFMRSDLVYRSGALPSLVCRVVGPHERNTVFCDQDWHAQFIEGAGDRCLVASPLGANALFGCYEQLLEAAAPDSPNAAAKQRFGAHQALQAYLYGNGFSVVPAMTTDADIYRAGLPPALAASALKADAKHTNDQALRTHILSILAALEY